MWLLFISLIFILSLSYLYLWSKNKYEYWTKRGVKGPRPVLPFGNIRSVALLQERIDPVLHKYYNEYPNEPVVGLYIGFKPILLVRDPEYIKLILIKNFKTFNSRGISPGLIVDKSLFTTEGPVWKSMRSHLSAAFTTGKLKKIDSLLDECFKDSVKSIDKLLEKGADHDINTITINYSLALIAIWLFGVDIESFGENKSKFADFGRQTLEPDFTVLVRLAINFFIPHFFEVLGFVGVKHHGNEINEFFSQLLTKFYKERKDSGIQKYDVIDILIKLMEKQNLSQSDRNSVEDSSRIPGIQLATFFAAIYETSLPMSFVLHELAFHQDIQEKAYSEIKNVMKKHNGLISYDAVHDMTYLDMVFNEVLRFYTIPVIRIADEDFTFPRSNIRIDKGTHIIISSSGLHMDPKYFKDPETLNPERFSSENAPKIPSYAFLPFGGGPRYCIGKRFGKVQVLSGVAMILSRFKLEPSEKSERPLKMDTATFVRRPKSGVWLKITRRT